MIVRRPIRVPRSLGRRSYSAGGGGQNPAQYCLELVRKHDYESYLLAPFYPPELRDGYCALKAFSVELATIQDTISNPVIGQMRMQFWRDAIKGIADGKPPHHPIALALHETTKKVHLPFYHFKRIIDAREAELQSTAHMTIDSLTSHAESTSSSMIYLLLSMMSVSTDTMAHAASHLGVAQTLATLLRALPFHAINRRMVIPAEITARHKVVQEDVFRQGGGAPGIDDAVFELATVANDHLMTARSMFDEGGFGGKVPKEVLPVFLAGVPVSNVLSRLEKANFDAFTPGLQLRDWKLPWYVWKSSFTRKF